MIIAYSIHSFFACANRPCPAQDLRSPNLTLKNGFSKSAKMDFPIQATVQASTSTMMDATHATMTILHVIYQLISCNVCMAWSNISSTSKWSLISYAKKKGTSTSPQKRNIFNSPNALPKNMRSPCEASSISSARFQRSTFDATNKARKYPNLSSFTGFLKDLARDLLKSLSG